MLRKYQQKCLEAIWGGFRKGNPLVCIPTGGGKSHVIAGLCEKAIVEFPDTHILMLVHRKELLEQNANKLAHLLPFPISFYCAGMNRKELGQVTFASVQSLAKFKGELPPFEIVIVDECHRIPLADFGEYRKIISRLKDSAVVGFTATPYRMGGGKIYGEDLLFTELTYEVGIDYLIGEKYLSPVVGYQRKKGTALLDGIPKSSTGDYVKGKLQDAYSVDGITSSAVADLLEKAHDRRSIMIFSAGVEHAHMIVSELKTAGEESCAVITGTTEKQLRHNLIDQFKTSQLRILVNMGVFTEGFDAPKMDCVALMVSTLSLVKYLQMVGRGMRVDKCKTDCLLLDYGENIVRHGEVNNIVPPSKGRETQPKTTRICPMCELAYPNNLWTCPSCGYEIPRGESFLRAKHTTTAANVAPLVDREGFYSYSPVGITFHEGQKEGKPPYIKVTYLHPSGYRSASVFLCPEHGGYAARKTRVWGIRHGIPSTFMKSVEELSKFLHETGMLIPSDIEVKSAKFPEVVSYIFPKGVRRVRWTEFKFLEEAPF